MDFEVGTIVEGKVSGVTKFGAFVDLSEGTTGMVHISEVAHTYVSEIGEFIKIGDVVKVKVLPSDNGKIALSIKQATPKPENSGKGQKSRQRKPYKPAPPVTSPGDFEWQSTRSTATSFEDMMSKFKQTSEDKMSDLKRANGGESRGYSRRGGSRK